MPLVPGELAAAEDMNTVFSDIATALTNSVPTDGSAAITGNLNMNGYSITGATNITAGNVTASGTVTAPVFNATTGMYVTAFLSNVNGNGQNITNLSTLSANQLTSNGNINAAGSVSASGNLVAGNTVQGAYLHSTGNVQADGTFTGGAVSVSGGITGSSFNTGGPIYGGSMNISGSGSIANLLAGGYGVIYPNYHPTNAFAFYDTTATYIYIYENGGAVGSLVPPSTARVKGDIVYSEFDCLEAVLNTPLFAFRRQGSDVTTPVGFVAEKQYAVFPESVLMHEEKPWGIDIMTAVATLYGAVQQLAARPAA